MASTERTINSPNRREEVRAEKSERDLVVAQLWEEFARLNRTFFDTPLELNEIILSTRKQYGGYCVPTRKRIVLSWLAYREYGWDETVLTFRHEVAHLVHPNHSKQFWELAERLGSTRRYALPPRERSHAYSRYTYECPACHTRVFRHKRLVNSSCGVCDTKFNPNYKLHLVDSAARRAHPTDSPQSVKKSG